MRLAKRVFRLVYDSKKSGSKPRVKDLSTQALGTNLIPLTCALASVEDASRHT